MRILIHDFAADSFSVELAREFAKRGCHVRYAYFDESGSVRANVAMTASDPETFASVGIGVDDPQRRVSIVRRFRHDVAYSQHLVSEIADFGPDVMISANCPPVSQWRAQREVARQGGRFVFWLQDLFGLATESVLSRLGSTSAAWISKPFRSAEHRLLRNADHVLAIAPSFVRYAVEEAGVEAGRVTLRPNWAPIDELRRDVVTPSSWRAEVGIPAGPLFLYSGTLGLKHNPPLLAELAKRLEAHGASVAVVSQGVGRDQLEAIKCAERIRNLHLLDLQPFARLPEVFQSADVMLAILNADASEFSIPSKILPYLCVGRPTLALMPKSNFSSQILLEAGAGFVAEPRDLESAVAAAIKLIRTVGLAESMGSNALSYAEEAFNVEEIADHVSTALGLIDLRSSHPEEKINLAEVPAIQDRNKSRQGQTR